MSSWTEVTLRRHQLLTLSALVLLVLLAWAWLLSGAGMAMGPTAATVRMPGTDASMANMPMVSTWTAGRVILTFAMWWIMMVAMMLPSAAPTVLLYARAMGQVATARPATGAFLAGYLLVWGMFSVLATILQVLLETLDLLAPMAMAPGSRTLSAAMLVATGLYQLSPLKQACLRHCRGPAVFISRHFRPGTAGALRMGAVHGAYCVGCCWLLMTLLFVGGIMNLAWIAFLTLLVALEKLLPFGHAVGKLAGLGCIVWGAVILL